MLLEKTREAYDTLRRTQEQLLQSEKMAAVGQLISGVAHELNNPLTAILGYSQLLKSDKQPYWSWIGVSPDSRWLLYAQLDGQPGSDLMLVENFH